MFDITKFSKRYRIIRITNHNQDELYDFFLGNKQYFEYVPPMITRETTMDGIKELPPNKGYEDKYYVGYYSDHLVAVLDLIDQYPNSETAFIGLFMMNSKDQGKYYGWNIIQELCFYLKEIGVKYIRLGVVDTNEPAKFFWDKCGFSPTGIVAHEELYDIIVYQKQL